MSNISAMNGVQPAYTQKNSSKAAKIGKAVASAYLPGLGQMIDGRFKDGAKDMGKNVGLNILGGTTAFLGYKNFVKATQAGKTPYGFYAAIAGGLVVGAAAIANRVHSIKDAYKKG